MHALLLGTPWAFLALGLLTAGLLVALWRSRSQARRIVRRLEEDEARLRAITRVLPDLMMVLDEDGRYVELYTADESRLVAPRDLMLGRTVFDCLPADSARFIFATMRRALETTTVITVEYPLEVQAGRLWLEARVTAMDQQIEGRRCVVWVSRDITERRRQEENQRQSQKLESLGVLAGGIAHDFNNLLMVLQGNLNLIQMYLPKDSWAATYLPRTEEAIRKASELAGQMLAYSGRAAYHIQTTDLFQVLEEMKTNLRSMIPGQVELDIRHMEDLPQVRCDRGQFRQMLLNLVINAGEAIGKREGRITLSTGMVDLDEAYIRQNLSNQALEPGPHATLEVSDTGCGMEPELLRQIFDPFFTTKRTGRGLGLSTTLGILRGHRAGILVWTQPGQGSIFKLFLPVQPEPAKPQIAAGSQCGFAATKRRVLLVDDEREVRETIRGMLELLGVDVSEAPDGHRALELLKSEPRRIDIVLLDLTMPRMNGNETFRAIRALCPAMPVVFSSGYSLQDIAVSPTQDPTVGFVQKPYTLKQLQQVLAGVLCSVGEETSV